MVDIIKYLVRNSGFNDLTDRYFSPKIRPEDKGMLNKNFSAAAAGMQKCCKFHETFALPVIYLKKKLSSDKN